ncbi:MAG TPA: MarC family protein [Armatimonadota bacterium]|jgi:multiple antibiotic resistance protein
MTPLVKAFISLFAIVNPLSAVPVILSLSPHQTMAERKTLAFRSAAAMTFILLLSSVAGETILRGFGIGVPSFRVGGGILLMLVAVDMWHARQSGSQHTAEEDIEAEMKDDIAVVPLATPLLAGPGAISAVILYSQGMPDAVGRWELAAVILAVGLCSWVAMRLAVPAGARMGRTGINIMTRLMGLILAAIAVEFIAGGMRELFPALVRGA